MAVLRSSKLFTWMAIAAIIAAAIIPQPAAADPTVDELHELLEKDCRFTKSTENWSV
ncbi:hypothetical protein XYCOK13_08030 [Xylanibacillus composti]|uniref:Uncharacterized protein n=1 Tax=Xylanibacillus composti TaxID=1572762 RepID=A0A8J4GZD9_9BACL|nr:hypothetical protein [Xylanibacillus composti]GIQ67979.1 hypothetical protein XYCOK13_08030 [Xylanibacillus composti]